MARRPERKHTLAITVTFDRPVSTADAARLAGDVIWGEFYPPDPADDRGSKVMKVRSIRRLPRTPA